MQTLFLTLPTPQENLALDEALLDTAEAQVEAGDEPTQQEILRLWEPQQPFVVLGRSSRLENEVDEAACQAHGIPILRRASGGASIVTGPGCLMYAVVLSYDCRPGLRALDQAHAHVLDRIVTGLAPRVPGLARRGTSDLAIHDRKVSGNSLRCKRHFLLYHGTLLYDFPLELLTVLLKSPPRQPAYRQQREHQQFVANLPLPQAVLQETLLQAWDASSEAPSWPRELTNRLVSTRYERDTWNFHYP